MAVTTKPQTVETRLEPMAEDRWCGSAMPVSDRAAKARFMPAAVPTNPTSGDNRRIAVFTSIMRSQNRRLRAT